jgi:hypothetical protein
MEMSAGERSAFIAHLTPIEVEEHLPVQPDGPGTIFPARDDRTTHLVCKKCGAAWRHHEDFEPGWRGSYVYSEETT